MRIVSMICEPDAILKLRKCLPKHEVKCYRNADQSFINSAEILLFLEWSKARKIAKNMKNLKVLQTLSAGTDHIRKKDVPEGVRISSNTGANAWAVAEHALTLILTALKHVVYRDSLMRKNEFPQQLESRLLRGKTVGIVGFGHIGQSLAVMLQPFENRIMAINRSGKYQGSIKLDFIGTLEKLPYILRLSDILILTIPLTDETRGLIDYEKLKMMKDHAILVNVARGRVIVEKDLYHFLRTNGDFVAALDTWWRYDKNFKQHFPFESLDNVILTPHCAGVYEGWLTDAIENACEKLKNL